MLKIAAIVDIGARTKNDDRILIDNKIHSLCELSLTCGPELLAAVADGVGGAFYGDVAAELALKELAGVTDFSIEEIKTKIVSANERVLEGQKNEFHEKMATTLTGVYIKGSDLIVFNVGDSRVYRIRNGLARQLTHDDSKIQNLLDNNLVTIEEAKSHHDRNIITKWVGKKLLTPEVTLYPDSFFQNDYLILCSDGLSDMLDSENIETILTLSISLEDKTKKLIDAINQKGANDNVSIIIIKKDGE